MKKWSADFEQFSLNVPNSTCICCNNFCITEELGVGICQDHNNGPYCDYDLGDCCAAIDKNDKCCACECYTELHSFKGQDWNYHLFLNHT